MQQSLVSVQSFIALKGVVYFLKSNKLCVQQNDDLYLELCEQTTLRVVGSVGMVSPES